MSENKPVDLSVVIPMYNESENIVIAVDEIRGVLKPHGIEFEIVLVNDGSTDDTQKIADEQSRLKPWVKATGYPKNTGRGRALRLGFKAAQGNIVISSDADLSYKAEYILQMYNEFKKDPSADVIIASAYMKGGGAVGVPWFRLLVSKIGNRIISFVLNTDIKTTTCVFRGYKKSILDGLDFESDGKEIHLEILSKLLCMGYCIKEVPVVLTVRKRGRSKSKLTSTTLSHLFFSISERPLVMFGGLGTVFLAIGFIFGVYLVYIKFASTLVAGRPMMIMVAILILMGLQMLSFGFIAILLTELRKEIYRIKRVLKR